MMSSTRLILEDVLKNHYTTVSRNERQISDDLNPIQALIRKHQKEKKDYRQLNTGKVGNGKSSLSLNVAIYTDNRFVDDPHKAIKENLHFLSKDWVKAASILPNFSATIIDEGVLAAFNRSFMNPENIALVKVFSTMRFKRFTTQINIPVIDSLDISLRKMCDVMVSCNSQGRGEAFEIVTQKFGGPVWHKTIIDDLRWNMPDPKLWKIYEDKKFSIEGDEYRSYSSRLESKHQLNKTDDMLLEDMSKKHDSLFNDKGVMTISKVMIASGVGKDRANRLRDKYRTILDAAEK